MTLWKRRVEPWARPLFHRWARLSRGLTLGVRAVVTDGERRVLLIEHTYVSGWHLPGGGVDRGESIEAAVARELLEETGVRPTARPVLLSVHDNAASFAGDHVLLYRVSAWERVEATARGEILHARFFPLDALPPGVTRGTRRRLAEVFEGAPPDLRW